MSWQQEVTDPPSSVACSSLGVISFKIQSNSITNTCPCIEFLDVTYNADQKEYMKSVQFTTAHFPHGLGNKSRQKAVRSVGLLSDLISS